MKPIAAVILDTRKMTTTGENAGRYHVKIRVTFPSFESGKKVWIRRFYKTGVFVNAFEFEMMMGNPRNTELVDKKRLIVELQNKANDIIKVRDINPELFERLFTNSGGMDNIITVFDLYIKNLEDEDRYGTMYSYRDARNSFMKFKGGNFISFSEITPKWLKAYEKWMLKAGKSLATVGIYCRNLRAIFNYAINIMKIITKDFFPFGRGKYIIPSRKRKTKKAFTVEEKDLIISYRHEDERVNKALDFWAFSYFCNGCNPSDIARLKFENIKGDIIEFDRTKTERTEREKESIVVYMRDEIRTIISRHGRKSLVPSDYVFHILEKHMHAEQIDKDIQQWIKVTNKYLDAAGKAMNLPIKLTFGTARYTLTTILDGLGVDTSILQKLLGHGSAQTTEHYKDGFAVNIYKEIAGKL